MKTKRFVSLQAAWLISIILAVVVSSPAVAATLTVTNLGDSGPGTLRDRIAAAASGDTITFALFGTIFLNSELTISKDLRIEGQTFLRVSANSNSRVFNITSGSVQIFSLDITDGRVVGTNGPAGSNGQNVYGAGIFAADGADLFMQFCMISNNVAIAGQGGSEGQFGQAGNGGNAYGGGIASLGSIFLSHCILVANSVSGGLGGVAAPTNSPGVGGQGWGGGIYAQGTGLVYTAAIYGNSAVAGAGAGGPGGAAGGGIYNAGTMHLGTSTITSNFVAGSNNDTGGGVANNGMLNVRDCTIVANQADFGGGVSGGGYFRNTILALNSAGTGADCSGNFVSNDYNLIQNTNGLFIDGTATANNILGQDPLLGPLTDNGGGTLTMAPRAGSPVIDKGKSTESDQRFRLRPYDGSLPNAPGGNGADIGAVEVHPGTITVLNTNNSGAGSLRQTILDNHGLGGSNTIQFSTNLAGTITLTSGELFVGAPAILLGPGADRLAISGNTNGRVFTVLHPTHISGLTIRDGLVMGGMANQGQDGFDERGGGIYNESSLTLSNCVIRRNTVVGDIGGERHLGMVGNGGKGLGGGLYNAGGDLHLINCSFDSNRAVGGQGGSALNGDAGSAGNGQGGAIATFGGTNQMIACTLKESSAVGGPGGISMGNGAAGNAGQGYGAGLYSESTLMVIRSTISSCHAIGGTGGSPGSGYGGGVYNLQSLSLVSCTIASNTASGSAFDFGGGIYNVGVSLDITNSTIAGNHAAFGGGLHGNATVANTILAANTATTSSPDGAGTINSYDYNLIQNFSGVNIIGATAHVIIGQDPLLGPLADNGGPTPTMALRENSPAIDKGNNFGVLTDQRGAPRPLDFALIDNAGGGDNTDIGAFELGIPQLSILRARTNVVIRWPAHFGDFVLEAAAASPAGNNWTTVTNTPVVSPAGQFSVTNNATTSNKFYRLKSR